MNVRRAPFKLMFSFYRCSRRLGRHRRRSAFYIRFIVSMCAHLFTLFAFCQWLLRIHKNHVAYTESAKETQHIHIHGGRFGMLQIREEHG